MLEEGIGDHCHERVTVKTLPGSSLEVIEAEFLFELLMRLLADPSRLDGSSQGAQVRLRGEVGVHQNVRNLASHEHLAPVITLAMHRSSSELAWCLIDVANLAAAVITTLRTFRCFGDNETSLSCDRFSC
jgi:hypothetical protein